MELWMVDKKFVDETKMEIKFVDQVKFWDLFQNSKSSYL